MQREWASIFFYSPLEPLVYNANPSISYFAKRDLTTTPVGKVETLWQLPAAQKIVRKQQVDGSWLYPSGNKKIRTTENYNQLETFRNLGYLVEMFGFNKKSATVRKAAEFLFSFQTPEGDIRGILGNQYAPYYTAAIMELLIKAGYSDDPRITKGFDWLVTIRQNDGGWAIPLRTRDKKLDVITMNTETIKPDKNKPSSHMVTGIVLRAYAAHPKYRESIEAHEASELLLSSLFKRDNYPDRSSPDYWLKFTYPFWFTDLISALDSLSILGTPKSHPKIKQAMQWFIKAQQKDGTWHLKVLKNLKYDSESWFALSICRIVKRLYS